MGLNTFGKLFMPKNTIFYELFEEVGVTVHSMGLLLKQVVYEPEKAAAHSSSLSWKTWSTATTIPRIKFLPNSAAISSPLLTAKTYTRLLRRSTTSAITFMALPKKLIFTRLIPTIPASAKCRIDCRCIFGN